MKKQFVIIWIRYFRLGASWCRNTPYITTLDSSWIGAHIFDNYILLKLVKLLNISIICDIFTYKETKDTLSVLHLFKFISRSTTKGKVARWLVGVKSKVRRYLSQMSDKSMSRTHSTTVITLPFLVLNSFSTGRDYPPLCSLSGIEFKLCFVNHYWMEK